MFFSKNHIVLGLLFFILPIYLIAQQNDQVEINGIIKDTEKENVEGVTIYNLTTEKGTVSNSVGQFIITASLNDSLQISSVQFTPVLLKVNDDIINSVNITINLNSKLNELDEVIVQKNKIGQGLDLSYETLEFEYEFSADSQTSIEGNKSAEALNDRSLKNGLNFVELFKLLLPQKKESIRKINNEKENLFYAFKQKVTNSYISETFIIPLEKVDDFIYFMVDNGINEELLKKGNKFRLLDFINQQSTLYKVK